MGMGGRMAGRGPEPLSKKTKATLSESSPSQSLVATRNRFKIVHHHAIPPQGQLPLGTRGQGPHPGPPGGGERYATNTNTSTNTNTNANANTNARIEPFHSPGVPHGLITFPPKASPSWAAASKTRVGSTLSVVIDGSEAAFSHRQTSGGWSDVGPMLAIQFFEERGVDCVAFLPRQRVESISPHSGFYPAFLRARGSGAIASVPVGANSRLFIVKHALDKKAFVVTNDWLHDVAGNNETLAALGQTGAELRAYLSRHHVSFTFARDEFVPDPETPLARMLTQEASAKMAGKEASRTTTGRGYAYAAGLPSAAPPPAYPERYRLP